MISTFVSFIMPIIYFGLSMALALFVIVLLKNVRGILLRDSILYTTISWAITALSVLFFLGMLIMLFVVSNAISFGSD